MGRIRPAADFSTACELRMVLTFLNSYILHGYVSAYVISLFFPLGILASELAKTKIFII